MIEELHNLKRFFIWCRSLGIYTKKHMFFTISLWTVSSEYVLHMGFVWVEWTVSSEYVLHMGFVWVERQFHLPQCYKQKPQHFTAFYHKQPPKCCVVFMLSLQVISFCCMEGNIATNVLWGSFIIIVNIIIIFKTKYQIYQNIVFLFLWQIMKLGFRKSYFS